MVGRKFVALYVRVRFSPVTPKERWVSGLNQQFTKLPIQKVREFESHSFRKNTPLVELVDTLVLDTSPKGLRVRVSYGVQKQNYEYLK